MTEEHDTVDDVSRNADAEDDRVEVADENVFYDGKSLKGDNVVGVVPRNKTVYVTIAFAVTTVGLNFGYQWHFIYNLASCHQL